MRLHPLLPALALCALPGFAQNLPAGTASLGVQFGWNIPETGFSNYANSGYTGSIDLTYNASRTFALRTEFGRASNSVNASKILNASGFSTTVYNYNLTENAVLTLNPRADTSVYLIAGLGGYKVTGEVGSYTYYGTPYPPYWGYPWYPPVVGYNPAYRRSTTRMGYNGGIGAQFKVNPGLVVTVESRYTWIATQNNIEYVPIAIGFRFF